MKTHYSHSEIIRCSCGTVFAACADGMQDEEWRDNRKEYLEAGCTSEIVAHEKFQTGEVQLKGCDCPKTLKQVADRSQLQLF